jgi:hypothetical protein
VCVILLAKNGHEAGRREVYPLHSMIRVKEETFELVRSRFQEIGLYTGSMPDAPSVTSYIVRQASTKDCCSGALLCATEDLPENHAIENLRTGRACHKSSLSVFVQVGGFSLYTGISPGPHHRRRVPPEPHEQDMDRH